MHALRDFNPSVWGAEPPIGQSLAAVKKEDQMLQDACRTGDKEAAKKALNQGASPHMSYRLALGETSPLFLCASKGYQEIADLLIKSGAEVNRKMEFDGTTCLQHAAANDQDEMCDYLIRKGCNVNQQDKLGRTPLMDAAEIGSVKVVNILIANNADVNTLDKENHSALSYCIDFITVKEPKFLETACRLIEKGADANSPGKIGNLTLLHIAAAQGNLNLVKQLVEQHNAQVGAFDNNGKTPIKYAEEYKRSEIVTYLSQQQASQSSSCCILL